ncbi:hypothetical protein [Actinacidiphila glaucinigra]|uniref:hypothetical protein n=1 Tax=Actinacidiphila glaucinigra TaxID=235986 RepID=UPI003D924D39
MSYHMHLRALPGSRLPRAYGPLAEFLAGAWDDYEEEAEAGVAVSIEKDFELLDRFRASEPAAPGGADGPGALPVAGGIVVEDPRDVDPPILVLGPGEVGEAARFLDGVPFDALWASGGTAVMAGFRGWDEARVRDEVVRPLHEGLRTFRTRAAAEGHTVVKCSWF